MMKKKVKKIPKYNTGTISANVLDNAMAGRFQTPSASSLGTNQDIASMYAHKNAISNTTVSEQKSGFLPSGIATASNKILMNALGIEDNSREGVTLNAAAQGSDIGGSIMPGWGHLIGGVAGGLVGGFKQGSVDPNTGEITYGGIFGRSDHSLRSEANRIKNNIRAKTMTQGIQADYYNNPNVQTQPILAAEGGIMRKPVDALVSKGELIYDPTTKKLRQVPGSKGKPNKADDVYAKLYEGDVVISNSPTMIMSNGKTPAQNLMGMVDKYATGGTVKAREAIIKKIVNWQEANKTKPQEYAKFDEGYPGFFKYLMDNRTRPLGAVMSEWFGQRGEVAPKFDGFGKLDFLNGIKNIYNTQSDYEAPIKLRDDFNWDQHRSVPIDQLFEFNPNTLTTKVEKPKNTSTRSTAKVNYSPQNVGIHTHSEIDPVWSRHKTSDFVAAEPPVTTVPTVSKKKQETTVSKKGEASKPSSDKKTATSRVTTSTVSSPEDTVLRRPERVYDYEEPAKVVTTPVDDKKIYGRDGSVRYDYTTPERKVTPADLGRTTNNNNNSYTGSNWRDGLYRMAVLSQPLWDRAEAESIDWTSPVYKYMPTQIDVNSQLRDADQSYALARYNFANLYPNTGAGMAAGLQAASNRAKQYADIRQWQTNAQNELIGKNVGIYNNWANEHARILNDVYNKSAQNRATARNINRQNRAAALSNFGTMLSDGKKMAMERMKFNILKPAIRSTYEDATANDLMNMYNSLFV